jgi:hypothetical protein
VMPVLLGEGVKLLLDPAVQTKLKLQPEDLSLGSRQLAYEMSK